MHTETPSGSLTILIEEVKQSLRPIHCSGWDAWEVIKAILVSGASVAAIPPRMAGGYEIQESVASRAGVQHEVASGDEILNLC